MGVHTFFFLSGAVKALEVEEASVSPMPPRLRTLLAWWRWLLIIAYAAAGAALTVATAYRHYDTWVPRTLLRSGFAALHAVLVVVVGVAYCREGRFNRRGAGAKKRSTVWPLRVMMMRVLLIAAVSRTCWTAIRRITWRPS